MMGPQGQNEADTRLAALRSWQTPAPEPEAEGSLVKALLPLLLAQGLDFMSTEKPIGFNRRDDIHELMNPLPGTKAPGFAGTMGRMGAGGAELLLAALLHKMSPKLGRAYMTPSMSTHTDLARMNMDMASEADMVDRTYRRR